MRDAIDNTDRQIHIMGVVALRSKQGCYPKKLLPCLPVKGREEEKQTNEIKITINLLNSLESL